MIDKLGCNFMVVGFILVSFSALFFIYLFIIFILASPVIDLIDLFKRCHTKRNFILFMNVRY